MEVLNKSKDSNKSFDINKIFLEVENDFKNFESEQIDDKILTKISINIIKGLTNILKTIDSNTHDSNLINKICEFIFKLNKSKGNGKIWSLSLDEKYGEDLINFLKELSRIGLISQVDMIFRSGEGHYPLVNWLSKYNVERFYEFFEMLPEEYKEKLDSENINFEEDGIDYSCPLIGGTAL